MQFRPQEEGGAPRSPFVEQFLPLRANVDDGTFVANVRAAIRRRLPALKAVEAHGRHAVIVGGGPSLGRSIETVRRLAESGAAIFALNGTADWLRDHGIAPDYHVLLDARPHMARFARSPGSVHYLVASQCAPELFDALDGEHVTLWHPAVPEIDTVAPPESLMVGGGTTVGLQAMVIAYALGHRVEHLIGFDSCYVGADGHAYAQPENDGEPVIEVMYAGRKFRAAPWMVRQADEYRHVLVELTQADCELWMYGDGLIPHIHRCMIQPRHPSAACYDLSRAPASWDFCTWLVRAEMERKARGAPAPLRVSFMPGPKGGFRDDELPWSPAQRQAFLENVMRPLLRLVRAVEDPTAINGEQHPYTFRGVVEAAKSGRDVPVLVPDETMLQDVRQLLNGSPAPITITLREAAHWDHRNSDLGAWLEFARRRMAEGHRVIIVRDTEKADEPLEGFETCPRASTDVLFRAALYDGALINLFVSNGPVELAIFGRRPWLKFKPLIEGWCVGDEAWWPKHVGINAYEQFPWSRPDQRIVWKPDTLENLEDAWREFAAKEPTTWASAD